MRAREIAVGAVPCLALRVTYVGELGWELYCPSEFGLRAVGRALGGRPRRTGWSPAATGRSTRCGWRRATASGARTSRPTTRPTRRGSASRVKLDKELHRARGAARAARSRPRRLACLDARRPSSGRARLGARPRRRRSSSAASRAAASATRSSARSRTRTCPAGEAEPGTRGRGRDLRRMGRGRDRRRAALRPGGRCGSRLTQTPQTWVNRRFHRQRKTTIERRWL